eukprot:scaffold312956_cov17-Tisochrysis_lutea.AAC.1
MRALLKAAITYLCLLSASSHILPAYEGGSGRGSIQALAPALAATTLCAKLKQASAGPPAHKNKETGQIFWRSALSTAVRGFQCTVGTFWPVCTIKQKHKVCGRGQLARTGWTAAASCFI